MWHPYRVIVHVSDSIFIEHKIDIFDVSCARTHKKRHMRGAIPDILTMLLGYRVGADMYCSQSLPNELILSERD